MTLLRYPRYGQRLAPQLLAEALNEKCRRSRHSSLRLADLDESCWTRFSTSDCEALAREVVGAICTSNLPTIVLQRRLPRPTRSVTIEELPLDTRTFNCFVALRRTRPLFEPDDWHALTIVDLLQMHAFGAKCLIDFLVSFETLFNRAEETQENSHAGHHGTTGAQELLLWARNETHSLPSSLYRAHLPEVPPEWRLGDLGLNYRTETRLSSMGFSEGLAGLSRLRVCDLLRIPGFGVKCIVNLLHGIDRHMGQLGSPHRAEGADDLLKWSRNPSTSLPIRLSNAYLPSAPPGCRIPELGLDYRTATRLASMNFYESLDGLSQIRVSDLLGIHGFGVTSLLRLVQAIDSALQAATDSLQMPDAAAGIARYLEDELNEVLKSVATTGTATTSRNNKIASMYFGLDGAGGCTLEDIGQEFGLTRERVRQICTRIASRIQGRRHSTPLLRRAIQQIRAHLPQKVEAVEAYLHDDGLTRKPFRIDGIINAARLLGETIDFSIARVAKHRMIVLGDTSADTGVIIRSAIAAVRRWGAVTITDIAIDVSEQLQRDISEAMVVESLECVASCDWLDEHKSWFTLRQVQNNRLATRIRKILSVAPAIQVSDLRRGIARHYSMEGFSPPSPVLLQLCAGMGWCTAVGNEVCAVSRIDWMSVLEGAEKRLVEILLRHGSVMHRRDLELESAKGGVSSATFQMCLSNSPVLERLAAGVYGIRGARIEGTAVERLGKQYDRCEVSRLDHGWTSNGAIWMTYRVSRSLVNGGVVSVPVALHRFLNGGFQLKDGNGMEVGSLVVRDHSAWGLGPFLRRRGAEVGDIVYLEFDLRSRISVVRIADDTSIEELLLQD